MIIKRAVMDSTKVGKAKLTGILTEISQAPNKSEADNIFKYKGL